MSYYGSEPNPVSVESANEDVTDALDTLQSAGDIEEAGGDDLGDGIKAQ